jgi:hypothetical protein
MNNPLTLQDYELISAYLDNMVSPKKRAVLENRLKAEPELNRALIEIKHTRRLIRAIPVQRVPRNFTLSASQVPARPQRFFLAPALNFVSLAAAVLLVVVFAGSNLFPALLGSSQAAKPAAPMALSASAPQQLAQSTPMIITWGQENSVSNYSAKSGLGGGSGGGSGSVDSSPGLLTSPGILPGANAAPTAESPAGLMAAAPPSSDTSNSSSLILGIPDKADQGKLISTPQTLAEPASPAMDIPLLELGLGALAVLSALLAFLLRKTH